MKIKIEKQSEHHPIKLELTVSGSRKPMSQEFSASELSSVIRLLETAVRAGQFSMTYEVKE